MITIKPNHARANASGPLTLGGREYRARFRWTDHLGEWRVELWTVDGAAVALDRRLTPGGLLLPDPTVEGAPEGVLVVDGPEPYRREDLGSRLVIRHYSAEEWAAIEALS